MKAWLIAGAAAVAGAVTLGQIGRDRVPVLDGLPGWAGGRRDVALCERYIATGLAAPATYRRASAMRVDSGPLSQAAFDQAAGIEAAPAPSPARQRTRDALDQTLARRDKLAAMMADLDRQRAAGRELRLRRVVIDYDAANGLGVPIRATTACSFRLIDGRMDADWMLEKRADRSDEKLDAALEAVRGSSIAPRRTGTCCL